MPQVGWPAERPGAARVAKQRSRPPGGDTPKALRAALEEAAKNIRRFCEWQMPREWREDSRGRRTWAAGAASGFGGLLRAGRALSAAFHPADDGHSCAGCGRAAHRGGVA